jgi:hypothetical protein
MEALAAYLGVGRTRRQDWRLTPSVTTTLYRPVGRKELELIERSGFREFPPRLPEQPIFYPVLSREYAEQIAREWNTKDASGGYAGFVTQFEVNTAYLARFAPKQVGGAAHLEYWVPAEDLAEFNRNIRGIITVIAEFHGIGGAVQQ